MTPTPEQWELARTHIDLANRLMQDRFESRIGIILAHLEIARQALLEPVTDEMRAG